MYNYTDKETARGKEFTLQAVIVGQGLGANPESAVRISLDDSARLGPDPQLSAYNILERHVQT